MYGRQSKWTHSKTAIWKPHLSHIVYALIFSLMLLQKSDILICRWCFKYFVKYIANVGKKCNQYCQQQSTVATKNNRWDEFQGCHSAQKQTRAVGCTNLSKCIILYLRKYLGAKSAVFFTGKATA